MASGKVARYFLETITNTGDPRSGNRVVTEKTIMKLSDLQPNIGQLEGLPANPRYIEAEDFEQLKLRLLRMPQYLRHNPIKVEENNIILGGNMRYRALQALAEEHAIGRWTDKNGVEHTHNFTQEIPDEWVVQLTDYTLEDKRRIVLLDNAQNGKDDLERLAAEWSAAEINDWGNGVPEEWEEITKEDVKSEDDDFDEATDQVEARCSLGDLWQLGNHRLLCGDSTKAECLERLMGGEKADLWLTDPPYNVDYKGKTKEELKIQNDTMSSGDFFEFLKAAFRAAIDVMKDGAAFYVWYASREHVNFETALKVVGLQVREQLIWNKNSLVLGRQDYQWKHEPCLYGWKEGKHNWYSDRSQTTVMDFDRPTRNGEHPTMKPVPLFSYQMQNSSKKNDIVLDTFGGSGTTIVACEQLQRKARVMELDPHYCDVIIARWEKLTGKEAVKL